MQHPSLDQLNAIQNSDFNQASYRPFRLWTGGKACALVTPVQNSQLLTNVGQARVTPCLIALATAV